MRQRFVHRAAIAAVLAGTACGGKANENLPEAAPAPPAAAADSTAKAAIVDSTAKAVAAPKKAEGPLRDSAAGPKFSVDSNGKVTPIKPAAKKP